MTARYREWSLNDIPAIQHILRETWLDAYSSFIPREDIEGYCTTRYNDLELQRIFADPYSWTYLADVGDCTVGYERLTMNKEQQRLYVSSLYVLPKYQGLGIGRRLLSLAEEKAESQSFDRIWLGVMTQNTPALEWYRKIGFEFIEEEPFTMGKTTISHLIGYKLLSIHD